MAERGARLDEDFVRALAYFIEWLYYPFVRVYSLFCNRFLFESYRVGLTAHLVSRIVFAGTGRVDLTGSPCGFQISQRAAFVDSVQRIFWNERTKPIFDIKNVLIEPLSFLRRVQRLHLLVGDSNLSEKVELVKVGSTVLLIDRIERRGAAGLPILADPLAALARISGDPSLSATVRLVGGEEITALDLQRRLVAAVVDDLAERTIKPIWAATVLESWRELLDALESGPEPAGRMVEWVLKKQLLDTALWGASRWERLVEVGPLLEAVLDAFSGGDDLPGDGARMLGALPPSVRRRVEEGGVAPDELAGLLDVYLVLKRIDLAFHELDPEEGAWARLRRDDHVVRLLEPESVERAMREPPSGTRAATRGAFVRLCNEKRLPGTASWSKIRVQNPRAHLRLADPRGNPEGSLEDLLGLR